MASPRGAEWFTPASRPLAFRRSANLYSSDDADTEGEEDELDEEGDEEVALPVPQSAASAEEMGALAADASSAAGTESHDDDDYLAEALLGRKVPLV